MSENQPRRVASAFVQLFKASGGGALGLFTAAQRLRALHPLIAARLEAAGYRSTLSTLTRLTRQRWWICFAQS